MRHVRAMALTAVLAAGAAGAAFSAEVANIDWGKVSTQSLTLFYPGQSSFQWVRGSGHPGAGMVATGAACIACHKGQEAKLGDKLVKAGPLEPRPVDGKNGTVRLNVQVAYDSDNAYFRLQWPTKNKYAGEAYPFYRFDGKEWKPYGGPRLTPAIQKGAEPAIYEDRLSMMIDDGSVPGYATQGCWLTCHNGQRDNPNQPKTAEIQANPLYAAIKRNDVRKYLPSTRTDALASWDKGKSVEEIEKIKAAGGFLDLIQWRAHRSNPVGMGDDGYVLEWRNFDAGRNPFTSNLDAKTRQPRYMFDAGKAGKLALRDEDIRTMRSILVTGDNAVPFDASAGWKEGDLLPQYYLSEKDSTGSAGDNRSVNGVWKDGVWTVTWTRPLRLANSDDKALAEGKTYTFSFAVHDDNITTRGHHVSFPVTVGFGSQGMIQATRLK